MVCLYCCAIIDCRLHKAVETLKRCKAELQKALDMHRLVSVSCHYCVIQCTCNAVYFL